MLLLLFWSVILILRKIYYVLSTFIVLNLLTTQSLKFHPVKIFCNSHVYVLQQSHTIPVLSIYSRLHVSALYVSRHQALYKLI